MPHYISLVLLGRISSPLQRKFPGTWKTRCSLVFFWLCVTVPSGPTKKNAEKGWVWSFKISWQVKHHKTLLLHMFWGFRNMCFALLVSESSRPTHPIASSLHTWSCRGLLSCILDSLHKDSWTSGNEEWPKKSNRLLQAVLEFLLWSHNQYFKTRHHKTIHNYIIIIILGTDDIGLTKHDIGLQMTTFKFIPECRFLQHMHV